MKQLAKPTKTSRGFPIVEFKDYYGHDCSLQASSLAVYEQPGTSAIWLGLENADAKVMASQASQVGVETRETNGWVPYPIPEQVSLNTRMHLSLPQVKALIRHLQNWVDSPGKF